MANNRKEEDIEEEQDPRIQEETEDSQGNGHREMSAAEIAAFQKRELAKKIPGYGTLFHVDDEFMHEAARLSKQMIFGFAARDMQQEVLNPKRTQSAWDIFKFRFMGYTIAEDGKGRDENIAMHQLTQEEKEAASTGGLYEHGS